MILLYNVYITETNPKLNNIQLNYKKNRSNLNNQFNFDIFKYSIASVSKIYNWKRAIIYVKLDEIYNHRKGELEQFLKKEFEHTELILRWTRNEHQTDWIEMYELSLHHNKTIEKQIETNVKYNKLFTEEENKGFKV